MAITHSKLISNQCKIKRRVCSLRTRVVDVERHLGPPAIVNAVGDFDTDNIVGNDDDDSSSGSETVGVNETQI